MSNCTLKEEHVANIDCKVIMFFYFFCHFESFAVTSVPQLHSNVNKTKILKSFSHAVLVRPWKLDMGLIGGLEMPERGVCGSG